MNHSDLIDAFNAEGIDRNEITRTWYAARIKQFLCFLAAEGTSLDVSGPAEVKRFLASLREKGFSWSTRNGSHTALRVFYRWLVARGYIDTNPFEVEEIKRPRKPRRIRILPSLASVQAVVDVMQDDGSVQARRDFALILLLADSGLRRMEAINLNIRNVNLSTGQIAILVGKGDNQRWAYTEPPTLKAIKDWLQVHPDPKLPNPLFVALSGKNKHKRLNERSVNGILDTWSRRAGLDKHLRPHDLRRLFASIFSETGGGSKVLQDILGHENLETTEGYIITSEAEIRRQHKRHSPINLLDL